MFNDFLRDSPVYQEVLAEGLEKGLKKGLEAQRQTLLDIVQERFPEIVPLAKKQADAIEDPEVLRRLTVKMSILQTSKEAEQYILSVRRDENRH
jgi:predicted transposase YdaD